MQEKICGDPPLPVARLTPATGHRVFFLAMKKRLLLVDDDPAVRRMLFRVLAEEGYSVITAATDQEALRDLSENSVDLLLLELKLPLEDGWNNLERLIAARPSLPLIIITARPNQPFPALSHRLGALLEKPLDLPTLLRTIHDLLEETPSAREADQAAAPAGVAVG